jgi:hypothetical protein
MSNEYKDIAVPEGSLSDVMYELDVINKPKGLDRVRHVLALRMGQYNDIDLTHEEVRKIAIAFANIETGSSTNLVAICNKDQCLYKNRCALYSSGKTPEGRECLFENKILMDAMDRYMASLEVDADNYTEMVMINQLVEYELIEFRCNTILSYDHKDMKMETVIGIDEAGQVVTKEDISHALQIKMQIFKNKMTLLQELTATRREKYKKQAALKEGKDGPTKTLTEWRKRVDEMKKKNVSADQVHDELDALDESDNVDAIYK